MLDKLKAIEEKYDELGKQVIDPEVINDRENWQKLMKEHSDLEPIVLKFREYVKILDSLEEAKEMLRDKLEDDMKELVKEEIKD